MRVAAPCVACRSRACTTRFSFHRHYCISIASTCPLKQTAPYLRGLILREGVKEENEKVSIIEHTVPCRTIIFLHGLSPISSCYPIPSCAKRNKKALKKRGKRERAHTLFPNSNCADERVYCGKQKKKKKKKKKKTKMQRRRLICRLDSNPMGGWWKRDYLLCKNVAYAPFASLRAQYAFACLLGVFPLAPLSFKWTWNQKNK
ncbi:hypothetical protein BKA57DRAFT_276605 [Linnemannia elongata]|nr:hypothetical protein BKA57DRAFT_276605 [Linnemannia elongata]